jgi:hypothetical protein
MRFRLVAYLPFVPLLISACDGPINVDRCFIRLALVEPDPVVLRSGEAIVLHADLTTSRDCLPPDATPSNLRWSVEDTTIAAVDSVSGRLIARQQGGTEVMLLTARTRTPLTSVWVRVNAP